VFILQYIEKYLKTLAFLIKKLYYFNIKRIIELFGDINEI